MLAFPCSVAVQGAEKKVDVYEHVQCITLQMCARVQLCAFFQLQLSTLLMLLQAARQLDAANAQAAVVQPARTPAAPAAGTEREAGVPAPAEGVEIALQPADTAQPQPAADDAALAEDANTIAAQPTDDAQPADEAQAADAAQGEDANTIAVLPAAEAAEVEHDDAVNATIAIAAAATDGQSGAGAAVPAKRGLDLSAANAAGKRRKQAGERQPLAPISSNTPAPVARSGKQTRASTQAQKRSSGRRAR